ncbi:Hypothetical protein PHPALM_19555, partial [Phytophthora palmivora]
MVQFCKTGRPKSVKLTNVTNHDVECPAHYTFVWWVPHGDLPIEEGFVQLHTKKYREWQVLAYALSKDDQLLTKERQLYEEWLARQPPAVDRPHYETPGGIRQRPEGAPRGLTCEQQWERLDELKGMGSIANAGVTDKISSNTTVSDESDDTNPALCIAVIDDVVDGETHPQQMAGVDEM